MKVIDRLKRESDRLRSERARLFRLKYNLNHDELGRFAEGGGTQMAPDTGGGTGGGGGGGGGNASTPYSEGTAPAIDAAERKLFIADVLKPPGGTLKIKPAIKKRFMETGDVEQLCDDLRNAGGSDHYVARLRAEHAYAEKHGGLDVVKSAALRDVRDASDSAITKMSQKQLDAIQRYTTDDYYDVNQALRGNRKMPSGGKTMVDAVNAGVDAVGRWSEPATVYHGVRSSSPERRDVFIARVENAIKNKSLWEEKAILSTSASRTMAEDWI